MKKTALALLILALLLGGGLVWLQREADRRVAAALPDASARSGRAMTGDLAVSVLKGEASARNLSIGNPPGFPGDTPLFTLAEGRASLRYLPLARGRAVFREVLVKEADLSLVRLADGSLNIRRKAPKPAVPPPAGRPEPVPAPEPAARPAARLPEVGIDQLQAALTVTYVDYKKTVDGLPTEFTFRMELTGSGLATYGDAGADPAGWGSIKGAGFLEYGGKRAPLTLEGKLAPVTDPAAMSFRLQAALEKPDFELIKPLLGKNKNLGVTGEPERIDFNLVADNGQFDSRQARMRVTLKNVRVGNMSLARTFIDFPLQGTVDKPKLDGKQALFDWIARTLSGGAQP